MSTTVNVNKNFIDQKTLIFFLSGLIVGVVLMGIVLSFSSFNQSSRITPESLRRQAVSSQMNIDAKNLTNSGARQKQSNRESIMPWNVAANFIATAPVQKIQILSGLSLKLFMKNGPTFTTTQPSQDAYLEFLKKSTNSIEVIK